jgi:hypothetical protein
LTNGAILSGWPAGGLDLAANPRRRISDGRSDAILDPPLVRIAQRESRTSTEHVAQSSAMNSWHGLITVIGQMPRRYRDLASGPSASSVGAKSSSSDSSNSNANVACTRLGDQARRTLSRSKVPRRPRTHACRPIRRLASDGPRACMSASDGIGGPGGPGLFNEPRRRAGSLAAPDSLIAVEDSGLRSLKRTERRDPVRPGDRAIALRVGVRPMRCRVQRAHETGLPSAAAFGDRRPASRFARR